MPSADTWRRVLRTFVITFLGLFVPGLLGWLHDITAWASSNGHQAFPDGHGLVYVGVSALAAAVVAIVNLLWNWVEEQAGSGFLRSVPPKAPKHAA